MDPNSKIVYIDSTMLYSGFTMQCNCSLLNLSLAQKWKKKQLNKKNRKYLEKKDETTQRHVKIVECVLIVVLTIGIIVQNNSKYS